MPEEAAEVGEGGFGVQGSISHQDQMLEGKDGACGQLGCAGPGPACQAFLGPFVLLPQLTPWQCVGIGQREVSPVLKWVLYPAAMMARWSLLTGTLPLPLPLPTTCRSPGRAPPLSFGTTGRGTAPWLPALGPPCPSHSAQPLGQGGHCALDCGLFQWRSVVGFGKLGKKNKFVRFKTFHPYPS